MCYRVAWEWGGDCQGCAALAFLFTWEMERLPFRCAPVPSRVGMGEKECTATCMPIEFGMGGGQQTCMAMGLHFLHAESHGIGDGV